MIIIRNILKIEIFKIKKDILNNIDYLKNFNKIEINNIIDFLLKTDYVTFNDTISVFNPIDKINYMDNYNSLVLNIKGIIGKNINECNEILFTELLMSRMFIFKTCRNRLCFVRVYR